MGETVSAVVARKGSVAWERVPWPAQPEADEVMVRTHAAALNGADLRVRRESGEEPARPGVEVAGEVQAVGSRVTTLAVGQRVMGLVPSSGQGEVVVIPADTCIPVPDGMGWAEAGAFCEAFTTAHDALFTNAGLRPGEVVCVHGAAGGVGTAAVQLAVAAGAQVVATVRSVPNRSRLRALLTGDVEVVAPEEFPKHSPFDVVLELVGAPNLRDDVDGLALGGRVVVIGVGAGETGTLDLRKLMHRRGAVLGSVLKSRSNQEKGKALRVAASMALPLIAAGEVVVPIERTYQMSEAGEAYEFFRAGRKLGKVVLTS